MCYLPPPDFSPKTPCRLQQFGNSTPSPTTSSLNNRWLPCVGFHGDRIVMDWERYFRLIDECGDNDRMNELASCRYRNQCGVHDDIVDWIGEDNKPTEHECPSDCNGLYAVWSA